MTEKHSSDIEAMEFFDEFASKFRAKHEHEDNELLGYMQCGAFIIGSVDEVNGRGAEVIEEFKPTRHELEQLAEYWYRELLKIDVFYFLTGQTGSSDCRIRSFSQRRIGRIESAIGEEAVRGVVEKVESEQKSLMGERDWRIFTEGTEEERHRIVEKCYEEGDSDSGAREYAVSHIGKIAVNSLPELGRKELCAAMRMAIDGIERGEYLPNGCDHEWQVDAERESSEVSAEPRCRVFQRCARCGGLRLHDTQDEDSHR